MITAYHCVVLPFTPSQVLALNFLYRRLDFKGAHPCAHHTFDVSFRSDKGSSSSPKHIRFLVWNFFVSLSTLRRRLRVGPFIFPELPSQRLLSRKLSKRRRGGGGEGFWINVLRGHMHLIASCLECLGCLARRMTLSYRSKRVSPTHEDVVFGVLNLK